QAQPAAELEHAGAGWQRAFPSDQPRRGDRAWPEMHPVRRLVRHLVAEQRLAIDMAFEPGCLTEPHTQRLDLDGRFSRGDVDGLRTLPRRRAHQKPSASMSSS